MKAMNGYFVFNRLRSAIRTLVPPNRPSTLQALMRQLEEAINEAELIHHLERRGMHGVAAKITEEIGVLLQHHDIDAGTSEQIAKHHAGRSAADDAAADFSDVRRLISRDCVHDPLLAAAASPGQL